MRSDQTYFTHKLPRFPTFLAPQTPYLKLKNDHHNKVFAQILWDRFLLDSQHIIEPAVEQSADRVKSKYINMSTEERKKEKKLAECSRHDIPTALACE